MAQKADWIAVDWGTSRMRAWAMDAGDSVLAAAASDDGMSTLKPEGYEAALLRLAGGWLGARPVHVLVCGMAGARQGWKEAAYREVPCPPLAAGGVTRVATADRRLEVMIVPGLCQRAPFDVMRGEETQLAGLSARLGDAGATVCMPGTHSKWASLADGRVARFTTFLTGELFALLSTQSILRHSVATEGNDEAAFLDGVDEALSRPQALPGALFSIRAASLLADISPAASRARLSGLLVGAELAATRGLWESRTVHLVGAGPLAAAYAAALTRHGATPVVEDAEALTLDGLRAAHALSRKVAA